MAELGFTTFLGKVERFIKYARVKPGSFFERGKCWISKEEFDELVSALPSMDDTEKRLLGETIDKIIASAVPKAMQRTGDYPGYLISCKHLVKLERTLRADGLDWKIAYYTTGSSGGDYWGIEDE